MTRARVGAMLLGVLLLGACGSAPSRPAASSTEQAQASVDSGPSLRGASGGTATLALDQVPTNLNDHTVAGDTEATRLVASAIWPQVFQIGPGQTPVLDTQVVLSAELVSLNPQTVVYQINPKATWSDRVPIGAADFVYAWQSQRGGATDTDGQPDSVTSTLGYRDISSVTGSNGGRTVTVVFRTGFADWESLFDDLLPAHVAERVGWNLGFATFDASTLVSGGPWRVQSWEPGQQIVLERNPHWWGSEPHLDRIVIVAASDDTAMLDDLRSGEADVAYPSTFGLASLAEFSSAPDLETSESLGTTMLQLVFNVRHPPLDDVLVRQGIAHAIDRAGIVSTLVQPLNASVWEDNDHLFANAQPQYVSDGAAYVASDPVTSERLVSQGGLVADSNGTWTEHGSPVTLELVWAQDDPWSALVAPAIAAQLVNAGFDVSTDPVTSTELTGTVLPTGAFDLAIAPMDASPYPTATAGYFSSASSVTGSLLNSDWSGFSDPRVDALLAQAAETLGSNQSQPLYQEIDQDLWVDMPTLPLFAEPTLLVNSASLRGVSDDPGGLGPMFSADDWYTLVPSHGKVVSRSASRAVGRPSMARR